MLKKIGLIGGGNIGGVLVQELVQRRLASTVALVDVKDPDVAKGKCLDIAEGTPIIDSDVKFEASKTYEVLKDADLIINTAGVPRTVRPDGTIPTPRRAAGRQPQDHRRRRGRHQGVLPERHRHLDRKSARRHRVSALPEAEPAEEQADGHGRRARLGHGTATSWLRPPASRWSNVEALVLGGHGDTWCRSAAAAASPACPSSSSSTRTPWRPSRRARARRAARSSA